jgi:putative hydrolase of the HAD superfamily
MWSQCLADVANEAAPGATFTRERFVPHLASGFPWHTPEAAHPDLSSPEAWWSALSPVLQQALVHGAGMSPLRAAQVAPQVRSRYLAPDAWCVYDDVQPTLIELSKTGWNHMILSNHVPELPSLVASLGLAHHFRLVLSSATLGYEKPHPSAFAAAIAAAPAGSRLVMVGDSFVADYKGAMSAGIQAVLVRSSHPECQHQLPDLNSLPMHLNDA